jgi:enoyl-CoA hydratase
MPEQIRVRNEGAVEVIEFANPPMNFITNVMLREFYQELTRVNKDDGVRVLVLTGGVKDSFITHYDVIELLAYARLGDQTRGSRLGLKLMTWAMKKMNDSPRVENMILKGLKNRTPAEQGIFYWSRCIEILDTMPKPVIAALSGLSLGGGCEISLCCDFRFMAKGEHYRIGLPEVLVGIIPGGTGTPLRLPRVVGEARALEMLLTGNLYTPEEAEEMGLIHKALPADELMPYVMELADKLARGAPIAQAAIKKNVRLGSRTSYPESRAIDLAVTNKAMYSDDAVKGMGRYVEMAAQYDSLDLEVVLAATESLRAGREVEYKGK